jgi:hypothetical protein
MTAFFVSHHVGPGSADKDAASVRADTCVPPSLLIYYFEVEIISRGRDGYIGELADGFT